MIKGKENMPINNNINEEQEAVNQEVEQQQEQKTEQPKKKKKDLVKHIVDSTNLEWVSYDEDEEKLYVQFRSGGLYEYDNVPQKVFDGLLKAGSKGRYHAVKIKWQYPYKKLN